MLGLIGRTGVDTKGRLLEFITVEEERGHLGGHLGPAGSGRPITVGAQVRPFTIRLDAARRAKLDETAQRRRTTSCQLMRDLIDTL